MAFIKIIYDLIETVSMTLCFSWLPAIGRSCLKYKNSGVTART